uniref:Uncharacterized protein n=1 Tax=Arundo donax TaxID=35708 RepID=A0A0A9H1J5_ARUDO
MAKRRSSSLRHHSGQGRLGRGGIGPGRQGKLVCGALSARK